MLNEQQKEKIKWFINDLAMTEAVYKALLDSFLKDTPKDVYVLAASRLAVDYLKQGFKSLEVFKNNQNKEPPALKQVGL